MRFAILGDHADGRAVASVLAGAGHELQAYQGTRPQDWPNLRTTGDIEDILADPLIEAVIVAGSFGERLNQLRRVLQSERSALVVHPVDEKPDGGYEIHMLQGDVHCVAMPILPAAVSAQVAAVAADRRSDPWIGLDYTTSAEQLWEPGARPSFPGWTELRRIGGEITEIVGYAVSEDLAAGDVVFAQGRFADGRLFRSMYAANRPSESMTLRVTTDEYALRDTSADEWLALVSRFGDAVKRLKSTPRAAPGAGPTVDLRDGLSWLDEIRALELDDALRQSIKRRRAVTLHFQEANEEVGFKGTMTLVGCALVWLLPVMLLVAAWLPGLFWILVAVVFGFLGLQILRWIVPKGNKQT